jgi:hypothetical protein
MDEKDPWGPFSSSAANKIRSTFHTTLKATPGHLVFGGDMVLPIKKNLKKIVFSELENILSTEQCRYSLPTKNKNSPANIQQAVAMSNNEDMEIDIDRGRGLRGTTDKSEQQKARGNKSDHRWLEEREREQQKLATIPMKGN